jgi:hypothetical protein
MRLASRPDETGALQPQIHTKSCPKFIVNSQCLETLLKNAADGFLQCVRRGLHTYVTWRTATGDPRTGGKRIWPAPCHLTWVVQFLGWNLRYLPTESCQLCRPRHPVNQPPSRRFCIWLRTRNTRLCVNIRCALKRRPILVGIRKIRRPVPRSVNK